MPGCCPVTGCWPMRAILVPGQIPTPPRAMSLPTELNVNRIQQSFAAPDALSFWQLPGFIHILAKAGFSTVAHRLRFQALLALPLLCATMALVAAGFSMQTSRRGGIAPDDRRWRRRRLRASSCCRRSHNSSGSPGALPVVLAAWAPAAAGLMLALSLLLHLEDG